MNREREILDLIADAVLVTDDATELILEANEAAVGLFGYSREELIGMSLLTLSAEPEATITAFRDRLRSVPVRRYHRKSGGIVHLEITTLYGQWDGRPAHIATYRDISARIEAERALRESEQRFRTLIDNLPDHIYLRDREDRFILANRAVAHFMGAGDPANLVGKRDADFYPPHIAAQFAADDRLILEEGKSIINQERCDKAADGQYRWTMTTKVPLRDETGTVVGLVGISRDFTESRETKEALRRSQEQLQQGQKMEAIGRLAGGIAHDFNNLLTVIRGFAQMIGARLAPGDPARGDVAEILSASDRAASLTAQLLAFGRKQMLRPRVVRIADVIRAMRTMLPRILGEDVQLEAPLPDQLGSIRADEGQIEQVIMNLAVNARDAMPRGGRLTITASDCAIDGNLRREHPEIPPGDYVMLAVSDTGTGMDEGTIARIFEPFFTTKEKGKGTGLGLATVYGIVKQSDGYIYCDSAPGAGTTFSVFFPRVEDSPPDARPEPRVPGTLTGTETVLLVEDEESLRGFLGSVLRDNGYRVTEARDGLSALEIISRDGAAFDILVTDVVMPRMGGHDLAERLLADTPGLRVLFMSGYSEESVMPPDSASRTVAMIAKPFDVTELLARLRSLLDGT